MIQWKLNKYNCLNKFVCQFILKDSYAASFTTIVSTSLCRQVYVLLLASAVCVRRACLVWTTTNAYNFRNDLLMCGARATRVHTHIAQHSRIRASLMKSIEWQHIIMARIPVNECYFFHRSLAHSFIHPFFNRNVRHIDKVCQYYFFYLFILIFTVFLRLSLFLPLRRGAVFLFPPN